MGRSRTIGLVAVLVAVVVLASACIFEGTWSPALPGTAPHAPAVGVVDQVDCVTPAWCLSAGGSGAVGVPGAAGRWDGTVWTPAPAPPVTVTDLDCVAVGDCWAIGDGRLHHFDGTAWTTPSWSATNVAIALSCPTATFCGIASRIGPTPVVSGWNGSTATNLALPPSWASAITDLACTAANQCMVVGAMGAGAFTGRVNGAVWTILAPPPGYTSLSSVGCGSATDCWAASTEQTGFARWAGGASWSAPPPVEDADPDRIVRCGPGVCVGGLTVWDATFVDSSFSVVGLSGSPQPTGTFDSFSSLACTGPSSCVLAESATTIRRWDGTAWSPEPVALASRHVESADDVACSPDGTCVAVSPGERALPAIRTDGVAVDQVDIDEYASGGPSYAGSAVSCPTSDWCAVATVAREWDPFVELTATHLDLVTGTDANRSRHRSEPYVGLDAGLEIDCTSATWCLAVYGGSAGAVVRQWNGTTWADRPGVTGSASVVGLDCLSPTSCVLATGAGIDGGAFRRYDGTSFGPAIAAPAPPGGYATLAGVACVPDGSCFGVGSVFAGASWDPWVLRLLADGTVAPEPDVADGPGGLTDVSCTVAGDCLAVGRATVDGTERPVSLGWRGHWDLVGGALPTLADGVTAWDHVSCAGLQCTVAGTTQLTAGGTRLDVARFTWPA